VRRSKKQEARIQETRIQETRIQETRIQETGIQEIRIQNKCAMCKLLDYPCSGDHLDLLGFLQ
jgi:hypothetical protein